MRLEVLENGHSVPTRLFLRSVSAMSWVGMPDVVVALLYRPEMGGGALLDMSAATMRGPGTWSPAEREYLAHVTAELQHCQYCIDIHNRRAALASGGRLTPTSPEAVSSQLLAVRRLLERVAQVPDGLERRDLDETFEAGLSRESVDEALTVFLVWDIVNRLAHAFAFTLKPGQLALGTRALHTLSYRMPRFLTRGDAASAAPSGIGRFDAHVEALRSAPLAAATSEPGLIRASFGGDAPAPWTSYVTDVSSSPFRVDDVAIARLRGEGESDEAIFEVTMAAAIGASLVKFDTAQSLLRA